MSGDAGSGIGCPYRDVFWVSWAFLIYQARGWTSSWPSLKSVDTATSTHWAKGHTAQCVTGSHLALPLSLPNSLLSLLHTLHRVHCRSDLFFSLVAQVFRGIDTSGRYVAVKVALTHISRKAAQREIVAMASLPPHINCLDLISSETTEKCTLISSSLALGGDTLQLMRSRNLSPLPEADARGLFSQLIDGLQHIHSNGMVHRDLKCENLLLTGARQRQLVIADFGFASSWKKGTTMPDFRGSLHYQAPEVCAKVPYEGPAADIWSAGVVLYAWTTGRLPFGGHSEDDICFTIRNILYSPPAHISPALRNLFATIFTLDSTKRPSLDELRQHPWMKETPSQHVRNTSTPGLPSPSPSPSASPRLPRTQSTPTPTKQRLWSRLTRILRKGSKSKEKC